ncbi:50S ribosomal protein L5 [Candidatus Saccharibacteria bacterium 32-45-3]|nr:MAG: 50S ribosomal protein L5 [Candidatus Saccharibacteria bacterium 32-45-3]
MAKQDAIYEPRLKAIYRDTLVKDLEKKLDIKNVNQVPKLEKIVVSVGIGKHKDDKHYHEVVVNTLRKVTGQQPVDRMAKKSIATFKIRKGMNRVGVSVTLRGARMYEFLDRLINVALPRVRDFHGVSAKAFDRSGNYNFGIVEQSVFPELTFEDTQTLHGMQVTFVIKSENKGDSRALLEAFGMPFEKEGGR